jgi:oligopeptide/dipeptide ABC transporter ATP-binding protein
VVSGSRDAAATAAPDSNGRALVEVEHLKTYFPIKSGILLDRQVGKVHAVDDVSFELRNGETLGLVGESGCGKTTLARTVMRLLEPSGGTLRFGGRDITHASQRELRPLRKELQMVFQDPFASLNPRRRVGQIVGGPLRLHGASASEAGHRTRELLERVGLGEEHMNRFPHEFSGGMRQRIGIARALGLSPRLIVLDEPVSALDVSIQAQIINLLAELQQDLGLSYLFVAHDLSVVRHVSDWIAVMYVGKIVELSPATELFEKPIHPYTLSLYSAVPVPDPREGRARERIVLKGDVPSPSEPPPGCRFHTRCPYAKEICSQVEPPLVEYARGHLAACHYPQNVNPREIGAAKRSPASPKEASDELPSASG